MKKKKTCHEQSQTVLAAGVFDLFHEGHRDFLKQASKLGELHVVVARDSSVQNLKKKKTKKSERSRLASVAALKEVSQAYLGDKKDFLKSVKKIKPDIITLGYDQKTFSIKNLKSLLKDRKIKANIIRLKSFQPKKYKTSILRK